MNELTYEESLSLPDTLYIDVRSPGEFNTDNIQGSVNIPLFDDSERKEVGILYKNTGKDSAIIKGTEIVSKKLTDIIKQISAYKTKNIVVLCARGGMRSGSVASLLKSLNYNVYRLKRGYRDYRNFIHSQMNNIAVKCPLFVLQGLTGAGKTAILQKMNFSIDLEAMAGHRSSVFGGIGLKQNSQKYFESRIFHRIEELKDSPFAVIEGESKKIGNLHLPPSLYAQMKTSPIIHLIAPIEHRAREIAREYSQNLDHDKAQSIVNSLRSKLGSKCVDELCDLLNKKKYENFAAILLEKYYDPLYKHTLKNMKFIAEIDSTDHEKAISEIMSSISAFLKKNDKVSTA